MPLFFCCITKYPKPSDLEQQWFIISHRYMGWVGGFFWFTSSWKACWVLGTAGMMVLSPCGLSSQRRLDWASSKGGSNSPKEGKHLLFTPHFLLLPDQAYFHCRRVPRVWTLRGVIFWGHYCVVHYNQIAHLLKCLLETCFSYDYPISLIIAPRLRLIIL